MCFQSNVTPRSYAQHRLLLSCNKDTTLLTMFGVTGYVYCRLSVLSTASVGLRV